MQARCGSTPQHSLIQTMGDILQKRGMRGFWHGTNVNLLGATFTHAGYFFSMEMVHNALLVRRFGDWKASLLAGAAGQVVHDFGMLPLGALATRMRLLGTSQFAKALPEEGVRGLYNAFFPNLVLRVPQAAVAYALEQKFESKFKTVLGGEYMAAGVGGAVSGVVFSPWQRLLCLVQSRGCVLRPVPSIPTVEPIPISISSAFRQTLRTEGVRGFYRGTLPCAFAYTVSATVGLGTYRALRNSGWFNSETNQCS